MARNLVEFALDHRDGVPQASRFEIFVCPACPSAHIILFDGDDVPFAQMTLGPKQLQVVNDGCREVFEAKGIWDNGSKGVC